MATVVSDDGRFEWNSDKDAANFRKHGFHFAEILEVFDDLYFFEMYDALHSSDDEERMVGVENIRGMLVVTTVFTERARTRIISSRRATDCDAKTKLCDAMIAVCNRACYNLF